MINPDQRDHWAQSTADPVPGSPSGVRPISVDALDHLGVDGEGNLYWLDTKILMAKKEFRLSLFQGTLATLTTLAAIVAAAAASFSAFADMKQIAKAPNAVTGMPIPGSQPTKGQPR